ATRFGRGVFDRCGLSNSPSTRDKLSCVVAGLRRTARCLYEVIREGSPTHCQIVAELFTVKLHKAKVL
ncbi:MAG: hypothetical protein AAF636_11795, partial [Pseudomonadota bacterium]